MNLDEMFVRAERPVLDLLLQRESVRYRAIRMAARLAPGIAASRGTKEAA